MVALLSFAKTTVLEDKVDIIPTVKSDNNNFFFIKYSPFFSNIDINFH